MKENRKTTQPRKESLRKEVENMVLSCNKYLKEVIKTMDNIILLRNVHPTYRPDFAVKLKDAGMITELQSREFQKFGR